MNIPNKNYKLSSSLQDNITLFRELFKDTETIIFREFENRLNSNIKYTIINTDGMINKVLVDEHLILPLMDFSFDKNITKDIILDVILRKVIISGNAKKSSDINELLSSIAYGDTVLFIDKVSEVLIIDTKGWPVRAITEPSSEQAVRGSREGFTESIMSNLTLIRRRVKTEKLKFLFKEFGTCTKTKVAICYIEGLADDKILKELMDRLNKIDIDGILGTEYIEEYINDSPFSLFKTIGNTESPDAAVGKMLEGRIVILCDGTPFVLTLPFLFIEYFQVSEDYYNNFLFASFNRMLRIFAFFLGLSVPAIYVGVVTFHHELIPTSLLLSISAARKGIPLPTVVEALIMLLGFDLLREGGVRLPKPIGQAISIVGALILGDAAVNARIISAPMVIITALTGISSFLIPKMLGPFIFIRLIFLILASSLGLYGYIFGVMGLFLYLMSLQSFGIPYMIYTGALKATYLKDTIVRVPWFLMKFRPKLISKNKHRMKDTKNSGR